MSEKTTKFDKVRLVNLSDKDFSFTHNGVDHPIKAKSSIKVERWLADHAVKQGVTRDPKDLSINRFLQIKELNKEEQEAELSPSKIEAFQDKISALEKDNETLASNNRALEGAAQEIGDKFKALKAENEKLKKELDELKENSAPKSKKGK